MTTAYDQIPYPGRAFRQAHPDRLATHAMLFGLPFSPPERCRVLEIGAGDGGNVVPLAMAYPGAQFVGFDLSREAVSRGQAMIDALGLDNIRLLEADIQSFDLGSEAFDYIIAHGVYSWVPEAVREAMVVLIGRCLSPHGVAFVSYNALPGCRVRQALRDILLFAVRDVEGQVARAEAGWRRLQEIVETFPKSDPFNALVISEAKRLVERSAALMAHDELGEIYHPLHLHEFSAHCARHGLQFLTEAESSRCGEGFTPPYAVNDPEFDVLAHAQDLDFQHVRYFRQSLLVRDHVEISRLPRPERLLAMHASSSARRNDQGHFQTATAHFEITESGLSRALQRISDAWPDTIPISAVIDDKAHAAALLRMYWAGALELHAVAANFITAAGERPAASPLARLQAGLGETRLTTLRHGMVDIEDAFSQRFIAGLDGSRTRQEIARDLAPQLDQPVEAVAEQLDAKLEALAHMPLLVA